MRQLVGISILTVALAAGGSPLAAQGKGQGGGNRVEQNDRRDGDRHDNDTRVVHEYFSNTRNLPPGLAKRDRLPPGLEGQIRRDGTLPRGLVKYKRPLPQDLDRQLVVLPRNRERVVVGGQIVILDRRTRVIIDIIPLL